MISYLSYYKKQVQYSDEIQDAVWNVTNDILFVKDKNLRYIVVNKAFEEFYNIDKEEILGKSDFEIYPPEEATLYNQADLKIIQTKTPETIYVTTIAKGLPRETMTIKQPLLNPQGEVFGVFGISRDVTELYNVRKELEQSNELLERIWEYAPNPIFVKSLDGVYIKINPAFAKVHGTTVEELEGKTDFELFNKIIAEKFIKIDKEVIRTGKTQIYQTTQVLNNKKVMSIGVQSPIRNKDGEITSAVGIVHDLTAFSNLENKIIESQKMDSITNLAAGVAHDLNNILSGVLGYASILKEMEKDPENLSFLENIITAANQATDLINKLMLFTHQYKLETEPLNLNTVVKNTYEIILPSIINKSIDFQFDFKDESIIEADPTQINQMVMNLIVNAVEAIKDRGTIIISTDEEEIHDFAEYKFISDELKPGKFVKLSVSDTGVGIPKEIQSRIFEPFFTTKDSGSKTKRGTGLGLAIIYGVVTNLSGMLSLHSKVNEGTTIDIYLPALESTKSTILPKQSLDIIYGKGTILCIDDEEIIHDLLGSLLPKLGYDLISAYNGIEGIKKYKEQKENIDCVLLDLTMPEMDGRETFTHLKQIDPKVNVILSTGYGKQIDMESLEMEGIKYVLSKPYTINKLSNILDKVINLN
jgi:PAS domain S-box-containing protein